MVFIGLGNMMEKHKHKNKEKERGITNPCPGYMYILIAY
jgi:hypothetical protein